MVTREVINHIMTNRGQMVSDADLHGIVRKGGWQEMTGVKTVMRVYAKKILDHFLDGQGGASGRVINDAVWAARLRMLCGPDHTFPDATRKASGPLVLCCPLAVKFMVWRSNMWQTQIARARALADDAMRKALKDRQIMPMRRWQEDGTALAAYVRKMRTVPALVTDLTALKPTLMQAYDATCLHLLLSMHQPVSHVARKARAYGQIDHAHLQGCFVRVPKQDVGNVAYSDFMSN
jgi:hypothetical protein